VRLACELAIEFQPRGSLPPAQRLLPSFEQLRPFRAPDSQHSIPTTLAQPTRLGTALDPFTVDNNVIYGVCPVSVR